jgi:hypothetical protein
LPIIPLKGILVTPGVLLYKCGTLYGEILQHCIGLNIPEPLDLLLAGESVEELELDLKKKIIAI